MNIKIGIVITLLALVLFSGCVEEATCGNDVCEAGETEGTCPADCAEIEDPPLPPIPTDEANEGPPELPF